MGLGAAAVLPLPLLYYLRDLWDVSNLDMPLFVCFWTPRYDAEAPAEEEEADDDDLLPRC
jgi:hypothetical protein